MDQRPSTRTAVIRRMLARLVGDREAFDIARAALLVAAEHCPGMGVERWISRIRAIGHAAARRADGLDNPFARLDAICVYLFEELGFHGNSDQQDDPRNWYLNEVLDRRTGSPLLTSLVFIEVARAAGFRAYGIGLPGHFVAGVAYGGRTILVDPFHGGQVITEDDCRSLVSRATRRPSLFKREHLGGTTERAMLERLLLNLKRIFLARQQYASALAAVERLLLVAPGDPREIRDRGFLLAHLGRANAAVADLELYLDSEPGAPDAASVRGRLAWLRRRLPEAH